MLAAAAGAGAFAPQPAAAAACGSADGVTVVVDFHELGGGVSQQCDAAGAGKSAAALFTGTGFPLTYVQRMPGFVCRVAGVPAEEPCVNTPPTDAYWGLYWSEGTSGEWHYATEAVGSLTVPAGGYVAFSWQGSSTKAPPGVAPKVHASASPSPSRSATPGPSAPHSAKPSSAASAPASASASATTAPTSASPRAARSRSLSASPAARSAGSPSGSASPVAASGAPVTPPTAPPPSGALPGWVVGGALALLAGAAGVTAYARRRGAAAP